MDYLKVCPDPQQIDNEHFVNIMYEYAMNYSTEGFKKAYAEYQKKQEQKVTREELRDLGYDEEDLTDVEI